MRVTHFCSDGRTRKRAQNLAKKGVKELLIIAQDSTYYGLDIYKERKLSELLNQLSDVNGIEWMRLHYAFPSGFPWMCWM